MYWIPLVCPYGRYLNKSYTFSINIEVWAAPSQYNYWIRTGQSGPHPDRKKGLSSPPTRIDSGAHKPLGARRLRGGVDLSPPPNAEVNAWSNPPPPISLHGMVLRHGYNFIVAGIAQSIKWLGYGLDNRGSIPDRGNNFFLRHRDQTDSEVHPASYQMGNGGSFSEAKATGAWSWPPTHLHLVPRRLRMCPDIPPLPHTSS
jgi:hypothetical protein